MNELPMLLSVFATGVVLENVVLARAFVENDPDRLFRTYGGTLRLGAVTTAVAMLAMLFAVGLRTLFAQSELTTSLRWITYFVCVAAAFVLLRPLFLHLSKGAHAIADRQLVYTAFNGAVYGIVALSMANYTAVLPALVYALGCSVGLTAAQLLIHAGRERISLSAVPRPFSGLPILMIYLGILSLAIYGLVGHQLPT